MRRRPSARQLGFTLVELMVGVAVIAILLMLAAPAFQQMIAQQRLKSINAELVTTIQYARSEAVSQNTTNIRMLFESNSTMSCYMVLRRGSVTQCHCYNPPGNACTAGLGIELHTTQIPVTTDVQVRASTSPIQFTADGLLDTSVGSFTVSTTRISGAPGQLQTAVNLMGRPSVCSPDQSVTGVPAC